MRFSLLTTELSGRCNRFAILADEICPTSFSRRFISLAVQGVRTMCRVSPQPCGLTFDIPARHACQPNHLVEHLEATMQSPKIVCSKISVAFSPPYVLRFERRARCSWHS